MDTNKPHLESNRASWNARALEHIHSDFYDLPGFKAGKHSLTSIELPLLGDVQGKSLLHLQCHFGQDTLSLARMGAEVTGVDLSDESLRLARELADELGLEARFVCCDVLELDQHLEGTFDLVFSSYGTIGWLPELRTWGRLIHQYLKPGGAFVFAEFHPVVWMLDDAFQRFAYSYFNTGPIVEEVTGTYTNREAPISGTNWMWNHALADVVTALLEPGLRITHFSEYDYSPWDCFAHTVPAEGGYQIQGFEGILPMVYAIKAEKPAG